jgi:hypothetical protein
VSTYDLIVRTIKKWGIIENIIMAIIVGITALRIVMEGRVAYVIVVAAADGEIIMGIVMGRLQSWGFARFISDGKFVADLIYVEIIYGHVSLLSG